MLGLVAEHHDHVLHLAAPLGSCPAHRRSSPLGRNRAASFSTSGTADRSGAAARPVVLLAVRRPRRAGRCDAGRCGKALAMHLMSISPRVVALSLGVAAAAGLVAGGAGLMTGGGHPGASTPTCVVATAHPQGDQGQVGSRHGRCDRADRGPLRQQIRQGSRQETQEGQEVGESALGLVTQHRRPGRGTSTPDPATSAPASPPPSESPEPSATAEPDGV